jgi:hypothetical protein
MSPSSKLYKHIASDEFVFGTSFGLRHNLGIWIYGSSRHTTG